MEMAENTVWAIMTGGLLSLVLLTAAETLVTRSIGALRSLLVVATISSVSVLLSGLPEALFPALPRRLGTELGAALSPLASALGLRFLGIWTGGAREDRIIHGITAWGSLAMLISALVLVVLATLVAPAAFARVLMLIAALNWLTVVLTLVVSVRATVLGDPLARWMVLACVLLAGMVTGLNLRALKVEGVGLGAWIVTAACTVVFVLIVMALIIVRNRANRRLARLARLETGVDPATGLPMGSKLLSEVDHVFWRTGRLRGKCVVVCAYLRNLYALGDALGRAGENQILAATAARIRRAVGFRCVVGLYHPRCFVIVFSVDRKRVVDESITHRVRALVTAPMAVLGSHDRRLQFVPEVEVSLLTVQPDHVDPQAVINEVEHMAMDQLQSQAQPLSQIQSLSGDDAETVW